MKINIISKIDWLTAMDRLSVGAFYLLNVIYRKDIDINDKALMHATDYGVSTHRLQKRELMNCNYLISKQVGKGCYSYSIGEDL